VPDLGLDVIGGARLALLEMYGDWHRDPWGWPELTRLGKTTIDAEADLGVTAARRGEYHLRLRPHFHLVEVPKTRLGVRPAIVQDPLSRLAYLSAVHAGMSQLNSDLPEWVYGWRMREGRSAAGRSEWASQTLASRRPEPAFGGNLSRTTSHSGWWSIGPRATISHRFLRETSIAARRISTPRCRRGSRITPIFTPPVPCG
jgi:hypothetical protein